jgi:hypothetical protein
MFMLLALFGVGFTILEVVLYEMDRYGWAVVCLIASLVGGYFLVSGVADFVHTAGWQTIALYAAYYFGAGVVTAGLKWLQYHVKFASQLAKLKASLKFYTDEAYSKTSPGALNDRLTDIRSMVIPFSENNLNHIKQLAKSIGEASGRDYRYITMLAQNVDTRSVATVDAIVKAVQPVALKQVDRISAWIATWPFVIVHTAFADIIMKLGKHVARAFDAMFGGMMRAIIDRGLK